MKKIDINVLNEYKEKGLIVNNKHPEFPLYIWNYTPTVQYSRLWDDVTRKCRGLITDEDGNVVAKGFSKFFNYEEHSPDELPNESFELFMKMDGSLIIVFNYNDTLITASRGSFISTQSIGAKEIIDDLGVSNIFKKGYSYVFEYISPDNRIVVNYGDVKELILLSIFNNDMVEIRYDEYSNLVDNKFKVVSRFSGIDDYTIIKSMIKDDEEGFVVRFKSGFRMKIKGDEYLRLHKILTNVSNRTIWEYLSEGKDFDELLDRVPDEFYNWLLKTKESLLSEYEKIESEYKWIYKILMRVTNSYIRKVFAEYAVKYKHSGILFSMYDKKEYSKSIWKLLYPSYSKPFANDNESN